VEKKASKKGLWIIITCIVIVAVLAVVLVVFKDDLFYKEVDFDSDIVIKRTDGQEPLDMDNDYAEILINNTSYFKDYIAALKISSVNLNIGETGIRWGASGDMLINMGDKDVLDIIRTIKYCKGITDISTISSDKERSRIEFYEGYSEDTFVGEPTGGIIGYMIIPSSMSKYISDEYTGENRILQLRPSADSTIIGMYLIIGEYTTKSGYDTIYVSYSGLSKLYQDEEEQLKSFVDSIEMDVYEENDLTKLIEYLGRYFADGNALEQYENKLNKFDEPYPYYFAYSFDILSVPTGSPAETTAEPTPGQETASPNYNNEENVINISRIDGTIDLKIPYTYADALIKDYPEYKQYITDLSISSEIIEYREYDVNLRWGGFYFSLETWPSTNAIKYYQGITSINEIKNQKDDCEITFYGDYTYEDLITPQNEGDYKGYAIIPAPVKENVTEEFRDTELSILLDAFDEIHSQILVYTHFKIIGEYVTTDNYDTIFLTYSGYNEKYVNEKYQQEYIESITIETRKDMDITPFITYLEKYFADADDLEKFEGTVNSLDVEYEFCYNRTKGTE
jgi:hypothetical protein